MGHPRIKLEVGTTFMVPQGVVLERAYSRPQLSDTPVFHPNLVRVAKSKGNFWFYSRHIPKGFVIFVPAGCVSRELCLLWVDSRCAYAVFAEDYGRLKFAAEVADEVAVAGIRQITHNLLARALG